MSIFNRHVPKLYIDKIIQSGDAPFNTVEIPETLASIKNSFKHTILIRLKKDEYYRLIETHKFDKDDKFTISVNEQSNILYKQNKGRIERENAIFSQPTGVYVTMDSSVYYTMDSTISQDDSLSKLSEFNHTSTRMSCCGVWKPFYGGSLLIGKGYDLNLSNLKNQRERLQMTDMNAPLSFTISNKLRHRKRLSEFASFDYYDSSYMAKRRIVESYKKPDAELTRAESALNIIRPPSNVINTNHLFPNVSPINVGDNKINAEGIYNLINSDPPPSHQSRSIQPRENQSNFIYTNDARSMRLASPLPVNAQAIFNGAPPPPPPPPSSPPALLHTKGLVKLSELNTSELVNYENNDASKKLIPKQTFNSDDVDINEFELDYLTPDESTGIDYSRSNAESIQETRLSQNEVVQNSLALKKEALRNSRPPSSLVKQKHSRRRHSNRGRASRIDVTQSSDTQSNDIEGAYISSFNQSRIKPDIPTPVDFDVVQPINSVISPLPPDDFDVQPINSPIEPPPLIDFDDVQPINTKTPPSTSPADFEIQSSNIERINTPLITENLFTTDSTPLMFPPTSKIPDLPTGGNIPPPPPLPPPQIPDLPTSGNIPQPPPLPRISSVSATSTAAVVPLVTQTKEKPKVGFMGGIKAKVKSIKKAIVKPKNDKTEIDNIPPPTDIPPPTNIPPPTDIPLKYKPPNISVENEAPKMSLMEQIRAVGKIKDEKEAAAEAGKSATHNKTIKGGTTQNKIIVPTLRDKTNKPPVPNKNNKPPVPNRIKITTKNTPPVVKPIMTLADAISAKAALIDRNKVLTEFSDEKMAYKAKHPTKSDPLGDIMNKVVGDRSMVFQDSSANDNPWSE